MSRSCNVCKHPKQEAIDEALVGGIVFPALVAEYRVSKDSLSRHKAKHLPAKLVMAQAAEAEQAKGILGLGRSREWPPHRTIRWRVRGPGLLA